MMLLESFGIALRSLRANKMRSFLTMLGIIIGVASVITMMAVGAGAQTQVAQQIRSLGANVLMVIPGAAREGGVRKESGSRHTLTESDAAAIRSQLPQVQAAAPAIRAAHQIVRGPQNWNTTVNGTTADYFVVRDWALSAGRQFSRTEEQGAGKVALIGASVAKQLFDKDDPVGGEIRISSVPFEVVGVLAEKGPSGAGQNQDDVVFVPISTAKLRLMGSASEVNREAVAYILVKAVSDEAMRTVQGEIGGTAAPAPPHPLGDGERFPGQQSCRRNGGAARFYDDDRLASCRDRIGVACCRRHQHHEHHAGLGHRAYARDRAAAGRRRTPARYPPSVPDRSDDALHPRRAHWHRARDGGILVRCAARKLAHFLGSRRRLVRDCLRRRCRHLIRLLPRAQGSAARARRGAPGGVAYRISGQNCDGMR